MIVVCRYGLERWIQVVRSARWSVQDVVEQDVGERVEVEDDIEEIRRSEGAIDSL